MIFISKILNWLDDRIGWKQVVRHHLTEYPVPKNLNILYVFGFLAILVLLNQLISGLWLTMFYVPTPHEAFNSVEYIMRDVNWGWLLRYLHSTGASMFFIVLYIHIFRGLLYGSYQRPRELVWLLGMLLFALIMMEAFFGYLLPWGQMSYWGAEVITALFSVVPWVGDQLVLWIRGDYSVAQATLGRFFALHVIAVPLALLGFVFLHIIALHRFGSNNPDGIEIRNTVDAKGWPLDGVPFYPHYLRKEFIYVVFFALIFFMIVFFFPSMGGYFLEHDNFTPANPLVTPEHIVPAWYLTPFYSILRAIPNKSFGVVTMLASLGVLFLLPWLDCSPVRSMRYKGIYSKIFLGILILSVFLLACLGQMSVNSVTQSLARLAVSGYFSYFIFMPWYTRYEKVKSLPQRINA